ncbi:Unknown protein sequence [Pseudomonas savastanoi pv. phaseolicola]|nr:Unknown protein sequence [Pseudomonas savastanoi pv. phaseolicola]
MSAASPERSRHHQFQNNSEGGGVPFNCNGSAAAARARFKLCVQRQPSY